MSAGITISSKDQVIEQVSTRLKKNVGMIGWSHHLRQVERTTGVEPASKAWEAFILPMNYVRTYAANTLGVLHEESF